MPSVRNGFSLSRLLAASGYILTTVVGIAQATPLQTSDLESSGVVYPGEHISWTPCGNITDHLVECSTLKVPLDQFDQKNSGNKTFDLSLIRIRGKNATAGSENIIFNPGGPGVSGVGLFYALASILISIVGEDFNILSFDPRGINGSTPLASCYASEEIRMGMSNIPLDNVYADAPFMGGWAPNFSKSCVQVSGEHGKYVNTPQVAADMNSILDAIGQEDMWYWGLSYGTVLGQTYADLFANRTNRMVIDGISAQSDWYNSPLPWKNYQDGKRVFWGFLDECIKAGTKVCPLASLSQNPDTLYAMVENFSTRIKHDEMTVYIDETNFGTVNHAYLWYQAIQSSLYEDFAWQPLSINLLDAMLGNATGLYNAYGGPTTYKTSAASFGEAIYFYRLNDGASGADFWPQTNDEVAKMLEPFYSMNPFMYSSNSFYWAKARWLIPKTHSFVPRKGIQTKYPLLMLSTQYDPVCSLESAESALGSFVDARLVVLEAYGHCTFYQNSACANNYVREYFVSGTLPEQNATCQVTSDQYFPSLAT